MLGCATSSKTWVQLPPLPDSAEVTIFDREPNVKFDRICEFEIANRYSSSSPTAITQVLKSEARKCGADGVINYSSLLSTSTSDSTWATGIKIRSRDAVFVSPESVKAFSLAIQNHDLVKVKELLSRVPKQQKDRAPSDDTLIDLGLYIATLDGLACNAKMVGLLEVEYEGKFSKFEAVKMKGVKTDSQTPLCLDVVARSIARMEKPSSAVLAVNNYYVDLLANYDGPDLEPRVSAYNQLLVQASRLIVEACAKSAADPTCNLKKSFLDFASKTKDIKSRALKRNAKDILKILSPDARAKKESA
ncbi:hypothetical protein BH10BDE1_BH10BDE1_11180 [soil metagenome]